MSKIEWFWFDVAWRKKPVYSADTEWVRWEVSTALNWEVIEPFESLPIEMKNELRDLVNQAQHLGIRDSQWENVRVVYCQWREPEQFDSVFPASRDISRMYKSVIDTTLIPIKVYQDWSCIYLIPTSVSVDENWWDEKRVINVT